LMPAFNKSNNLAYPALAQRGIFGLIGATSILVICSLVYGKMILARPPTGKAIRVAVVQGNIEQNKKWDSRYATSILQTFEKLTLEAARSKPDLIV